MDRPSRTLHAYAYPSSNAHSKGANGYRWDAFQNPHQSHETLSLCLQPHSLPWETGAHCKNLPKEVCTSLYDGYPNTNESGKRGHPIVVGIVGWSLEEQPSDGPPPCYIPTSVFDSILSFTVLIIFTTIPTQALINCGATSYFINTTFTAKHQILLN